MNKIRVVLIHVLIFILATIIGLAAVFNPAPSEPGEIYGVWFTSVAIFNILVIISAYLQLKVKKVWVFLITVLGLIVLFYFLPHIGFYIEGIFKCNI